MAITGTKAFIPGEVLTSSDVNQYLMRGVKVFGGTAIRDAAYGGAGEPVLEEGETCYLTDTDVLQSYGGTALGWVTVGPTTLFNTRQIITATNASWPVPTLKSPIVKVTCIGAGGGGGGGNNAGGGAAGGTTTFNAGAAGTATAAGGAGGVNGPPTGTTNAQAATVGFAAANGGSTPGGNTYFGADGSGGATTVQYFNLTGISTVNITIGAGGAGAGGSSAGGRGEVWVEYAS